MIMNDYIKIDRKNVKMTKMTGFIEKKENFVSEGNLLG